MNQILILVALEVHQKAPVMVLETTEIFTLGGGIVAFGMVLSAIQKKILIVLTCQCL